MDHQSSDSLFGHSFIPADGAIILMIIFYFLLSRNERLFSFVGQSSIQALRVLVAPIILVTQDVAERRKAECQRCPRDGM